GSLRLHGATQSPTDRYATDAKAIRNRATDRRGHAGNGALAAVQSFRGCQSRATRSSKRALILGACSDRVSQRLAGSGTGPTGEVAFSGGRCQNRRGSDQVTVVYRETVLA